MENPKEEICSFCDGTGQVVSSTTISRFKTCDCKLIPKEEPDYTALLQQVGTTQRLEKYSERFDNKDNEIVEGIFNSDTWGKRMVDDIDAEMEKQISLTQEIGEKIVKYLDKYKGQSIYNEIAVAIEFGYQLKLEEDEKQ